MNKRFLMACVAGVVAVAAQAGAATAHRPILAINEDNDHYFKNPSNYMDVAHLEDYVDRLARGGKVTHIFFCPTGGRASFDSKVWEPIWNGLAEYPEDKIWFLFRDWSKNAKLLHDRGIDPYAVWIRRCREKGVSPWLSPRMNDIHDAASGHHYRSTTLWRTRKDLHIDPTLTKRGFEYGHQSDYGKKEVRDDAFAMIRELLERYDVDGVELDGGLSIDLARVAEKAPELDAYIRDIRRLCDEWGEKRGHRILLSFQGGIDPDDCRRRGCDVAKWVREGLVDWVICRNGGGVPAYKIPVAKWRAQFGDRTDAVVLCGTRQTFCPGDGLPWSTWFAAMYRGWADFEWMQKPDGLYLFNAQYQPTELRQVCDHGLSPEDIRRQPRSYPVLSGLPRKTDAKIALKTFVGTALEGEQSVLIGFRDKAPADLRVSLNGVPAFRDEADCVIRTMFNEGSAGREFSASYNHPARRYFFPKGGAMPGESFITVEKSDGSAEIVYAELAIE